MYSVYGIAFNWKGSWSLGDNYAGYVVSFDADNSSSSHTKWIFNIRCKENFDMKGSFDVPKKCLVLILVKQGQNFA